MLSDDDQDHECKKNLDNFKKKTRGTYKKRKKKNKDW